jgi:hypothetical protein
LGKQRKKKQYFNKTKNMNTLVRKLKFLKNIILILWKAFYLQLLIIFITLFVVEVKSYKEVICQIFESIDKGILPTIYIWLCTMSPFGGVACIIYLSYWEIKNKLKIQK